MLKASIKGYARRQGVGAVAPSGYTTLRALNDSAAYVNLLFKGDDGVYRNLFGKVS
jgi:hypothetical protein